IVRADDRPDVEDAVLALVELPAIEHDHARDGIAALDVRDVERLDALDLALEAEDRRESLTCDLQAILLRLPETRLVRQPRVAIRELHSIDATTALRHAQRHFPVRLRCEKFFRQLRLLDLERDEDLLRNEEVDLVLALQHL